MNHYSTSDLALAAALKLKGFPITHLEREYDNSDVFFCFEDSAKLSEAVQKFYNDELTAPCSMYHASIRSVSSMVKSSRRR